MFMSSELRLIDFLLQGYKFFLACLYKIWRPAFGESVAPSELFGAKISIKFPVG